MAVRTLLLNLARDTVRLKSMTDQLAALSLSFERVEGVHGNQLPDDLKPYVFSADGKTASRLLPGEMGCYASHLRIMRMIAAGDEPVLVLEDDLYIAADFPDLLGNIDKLPKDWEAVRLSNPVKRRHFHVAQITPNYSVTKFSRVPRSTGAYLMTPQGARKFLAWNKIRTVAIDQDMRQTWETGIVTYGIYPRPIIPDVVTSTTDLISPRPKGKNKTNIGLRSAIRRVLHDMQWLGLRNWALSLWPKTYPDPLAAEARSAGRLR